MSQKSEQGDQANSASDDEIEKAHRITSINHKGEKDKDNDDQSEQNGDCEKTDDQNFDDPLGMMSQQSNSPEKPVNLDDIDSQELAKSMASSEINLNDSLKLKIDKNSKATHDMMKIHAMLDGEGINPRKMKGRNYKQELEQILNTTLSIKTFAQIDETKKKLQEENIKRIKHATYQIDISSQEDEVDCQFDDESGSIPPPKPKPDLQFISICKYSNLKQNDIKTIISKMSSNVGTEEKDSQDKDKDSQDKDDKDKDKEKDDQEEGKAADTDKADADADKSEADAEPEKDMEIKDPTFKSKKAEEQIEQEVDPDEPPVSKKQKIEQNGELEAQAVDEYGNALKIQGGSSSDQVSSNDKQQNSQQQNEISPVSISSNQSKVTVNITSNTKKLKDIEGTRGGVANKQRVQAVDVDSGADSTNDICNDSTIDSRT